MEHTRRRAEHRDRDAQRRYVFGAHLKMGTGRQRLAVRELEDLALSNGRTAPGRADPAAGRPAPHGGGALMQVSLTGVGEEEFRWTIGDQIERTTDHLEHVRLVFSHFERSVQVGIELMAVRCGLQKTLLAQDLGPLRRQGIVDREATGDGERGERHNHEDRRRPGVATEPTP